MVLGLFTDATYGEIEVTMEPGDRVVLYTDGILEASSRSEELYGADRFKRFLEINCSSRSQRVLGCIARRIVCMVRPA